MESVCFAESTIFLCFHSVRMSFLILRSIVITLLTLCTSQCDLRTHLATSTCIYSDFSVLPFDDPVVQILSIKKRPKSHLASLIYHRKHAASTDFLIILEISFMLFMGTVENFHKMQSFFLIKRVHDSIYILDTVI